MQLENGYELEGRINSSVVKINNEWREILIIESALEKEKLRKLFGNNNYIIEVNNYKETTYYTNGLIDIRENDEKTKRYVWLYFKNSISRDIVTREEIDKLKDYIERLENSNLEIIDYIDSKSETK